MTIQTMKLEPLSPERTKDRERIEAIWRKVTEQPNGTGLMASNTEWALLEALLNSGRVQFRYTFDGIDPDYDRGLIEILKDAEGVIEMTDEESFRMYEKETGKGRLWSKESSGYLPTLGYIGDMPVTISLSCVIWEGHKFVLWHMPSTVTDHRMARRFLDENMPKSAFEEDGCLNHSDATNAHNALHTAMRRKEEAA